MNIQKSKDEFDKYVRNYDLNIDSIKRKYHHSYRVAGISKLIAESLNFNEEEANLAILIGLLHDIARFEQWIRYETFDDLKSIDHGKLGVQILKENNFIRNFIEDNKYDKIIFTAVKNHNKFEIETDLDDYTLKFCKLIRDSDKIDILYLATIDFYKKEETIIEIQNSKISDECYSQITNNQLILRSNRQYPLDKVLNNISFVYDLNYSYSKEYIYNKNYISQLLDLFDFSNNEEGAKIDYIRNQVNEFLNNR